MLSSDMVGEFREVCDRLQNDAAVKAAVMISAKTDCFVAGADIGLDFYMLMFLLSSHLYLSSSSSSSSYPTSNTPTQHYSRLLISPKTDFFVTGAS